VIPSFIHIFSDLFGGSVSRTLLSFACFLEQVRFFFVDSLHDSHCYPTTSLIASSHSLLIRGNSRQDEMYLSKLMLAQGLLVGAAMACEVVQPNNGGVKIDPTKNEPVKNEPVKNAPVKNAPAKNETVKNDSILEPGVKWEICIHAPIKHDSVDDIIPSEATVFGIDLAHAQEFPDMIPTLKVGCSPGTIYTRSEH
jgi:hypothetical protein